ncbi:Endonuclease 8 1 [Austwickia sp. TVS 96-490-7B]|uniref:DNA-formamidopyrimidine glycosylase family protein n=1 Tax=Austwickia sp. TVS 96-490-7B TaxID=2830843 RepID=UPI001C577FF2|nr:DNA-formamidopyrimidine glycosylase family protein [Austwickia sp. TVS 96-490-7B]MBW3086482.1 Endonuclease 8 1 [Austwickia sp. TVS 96-490-7B]
MPEGDVVWRTARRLDEVLTGQLLTVTDFRWGDAATVDLRGRLTVAVVSRGKHLLHRVDGGWTVHSHLRMEGSWSVRRAGEPIRRGEQGQVRAVVGTDRWWCWGLRLGLLEVLPTAEENRVVGHLGPDLLGPDWDEESAVSRLAADGGVAVGAALLDQRHLAGIGTVYAAEVLFLEQIDPWLPVEKLGPERLRRVVRRAHRALNGQRDRAVRSLTGSMRRGEGTYVHGRSGQPCRRCGHTVAVAPIGDAAVERVMFFCPRCQRVTTPGGLSSPVAWVSTRPIRRRRPER